MSGLLALVVAALFAGAAIYISIAEQPARLKLHDRSLLTEWKAAYRRGTMMQAPLAILSAVLGAAAWWTSGIALFLVGALLMLTNLPWTLAVILPVNRRLGAIGPNDDADTVRPLVKKWGLFHAARSLLGVCATVAYLYALLPPDV